LIHLYEPFVAVQPVDEEHSALQLAADASSQFETLMRLYYLRHGFENADMFLTTSLNLLGFKSLNRINANIASPDLDEIRSTLILAAKGLHDLGQMYYLSQMTLRLLKDRMRPEEVVLLNQIADLKDVEDNATRVQMSEVQSRWPPSMVSITDDPEAQRLGNLIQQYMEMNLDSESDRATDDSPLAT
jgi:hypothetical protein